MKILFIAPRYHTNQIPIIKGLIDRGHEIQFWSTKENEKNYHMVKPIQVRPSMLCRLHSLWIKKNYSAIEYDNLETKYFRPNLFWLVRSLGNFRPDIIITREYGITSFLINILQGLMKYKPILYIQGPVYRRKSDKPNYLSKQKKNIIRKLFPKVCYTPVIYAEYPYNINEYKQGKSDRYFVPFVVEVSDSATERQYKSGPIRILDVGKYRDYKNHYVLVDAIKLLNTKQEKLQVTIVGQVINTEEEEYFNNLLNYIIKYNLQDIITLMKNVPYDKMFELYNNNHIFVLPSKREIASISVLEAMATGMPVISTDQNGTSNYVVPQHTGDVFISQSPESLAKCILRYMNEPEKINIEGAQALEHMKRNYSFNNYYEKLLELLNKEWHLNYE